MRLINKLLKHTIWYQVSITSAKLLIYNCMTYRLSIRLSSIKSKDMDLIVHMIHTENIEEYIWTKLDM